MHNMLVFINMKSHHFQRGVIFELKYDNHYDNGFPLEEYMYLFLEFLHPP